MKKHIDRCLLEIKTRIRNINEKGLAQILFASSLICLTLSALLSYVVKLQGMQNIKHYFNQSFTLT